MSTGQIAVRYAKALFGSAKDQGMLDPVRSDMEMLLKTAGQIPEITVLLESPILASGQKFSVLSGIFSERITPLSLAFIRLVTDNKREEYLPGMARHFIRLYKEEKGIKVATVHSAIKLDPSSEQQIQRLMEEVFKSRIELEQEIREDLIGGFVLRVEDKQLDASVKGKLARIKKELQK